jgi:glycosyltransferase involved in cell wall biosynthesis/GT2 family glycosyltransferase
MPTTSSASGADLSVVVPTYRRAEYIGTCVRGLLGQTLPPCEIVVVTRDDDPETRRVLGEFRDDRLLIVTVGQPSVIRAMVAGVERSSGSIIAFTDDDAVPRPDWVQRLMSHFGDHTVGGVGGRDVVDTPENASLPLTADVGRLTRWGRTIGNHHLGRGRVREVAHLKGVNMAFRRDALALPVNLRGAGTQLHFEIAMSAWARRNGWRLVYDPAVVVDHSVGPRHDEHRRRRPTGRAVEESAYNLVRSVLTAESTSLWRRACYGLLVGGKDVPGVGRAALAVCRREFDVAARLPSSLLGQVRALAKTRRAPITMYTVRAGAAVPPARPNVVLVAHDLHDHGGMERAFSELIRLGSRRIRFVVIAQTLAEELRAGVDWRRVRVPRRPFPVRFGLFFVASALQLRGARGLRHTLGALAPNRVDVATVQFCHAGFLEATGGLSPPGAPPLRRINNAASRALALVAEKWCYRPSRIRSLAAVSEGVMAEVRRHYAGVPTALTPNGVDIERFRPDPERRRAVRSEELERLEDVVALFVGGDWDRKGLEFAIHGLAVARNRDARLTLWVVGTGDEGRFARLAAHHGVAELVRFFGPRTDTERFYAAADIFVLPTMYETFCLAAYEAAASGLPIVATRVSGITDLVGADEAGVLVDRTGEAVGQALQGLGNNQALRRQLGTEGRRRSANYRWEASVESVLRVYFELLEEPPLEAVPVETSIRERGVEAC